jgi:homoserine kinase
MAPMRKPTVTVRVPASTSNLGPGFDTLGIALKLHNHISLRETDAPTIEPVNSNRGPVPMVRDAAAAFFARSKVKPHGFQFEIKGEVPVAAGLGSSVTVRLGTVYGLNEINGRPLSDHAILDVVTELEGHPDNCAPSLFGGFVVAGVVDGTVRHRRFNVPATLKFVCCLPPVEVPTEKARALLPKQVPLRDAVENLNRAALLTAVFATGDFSLLRGLFNDRLHQPYRKKFVPQLDDVIAAGMAAGALGGWLSGSGAAIICVTEQKERAVADAMAGVLAGAKTQILVADNDGTRLRRA